MKVMGIDIMKMKKLVASLVCASGAAMLMGAPAAQADSTILASMWDRGSAMGFTLSQNTASAGKITFQVTNDSDGLVHELLVSKVKSFMNFGYKADTAKGRVDEPSMNIVEETHGMEPGTYKSITVTLKPGKYLIVCNKPGHFGAGMFMPFVVY